MGIYEAAIERFTKLLACEPSLAAAYANRGAALSNLRRHKEALGDYDNAIRLKPDVATNHNSRANALRELGFAEEALAAYARAIALKPASAAFLANRAALLMDLKRYPQAAADFDRALALDPEAPLLPGLRLLAKMYACDWDSIEALTSDLIAQIEAGKRVSAPWPLLALTASPAIQRKAAEIWGRDKYPVYHVAAPQPRRVTTTKIRIGYFSPDFREHPVASLMTGLIEVHDREKFEIHAFSFGPDTQDPMRRRLERAFDKFSDVRWQSDREIADLARSYNLDIAVDLAGLTALARPGIFALRPARVQVSYLGYAGTTGTGHLDYLVADSTLVHQTERRFYSEKIVSLPECFQANDDKRPSADRVFSRAELALPPAAFVFCCFNNAFKIMPATFDGWMRVLKAVPHSILWLFEHNHDAVENLRREAARRGIDAERLIFAPRMPAAAEHLARYRTADVFLDTFPYTAHTTASDALWMGLPVVTRPGESMASRVTASLLKTAGLAELIARDQAEYEALAIAIAHDPGYLAAIKQELARSRERSPLFNTARFARYIEKAFMCMVDRHAAGLPPDHIDIAP